MRDEELFKALGIGQENKWEIRSLKQAAVDYQSPVAETVHDIVIAFLCEHASKRRVFRRSERDRQKKRAGC